MKKKYEEIDAFLLTDEYKYISDEIKAYGKVNDLESYITKFTNIYFNSNKSRDEIFWNFISYFKYTLTSYKNFNINQKTMLNDYVYRAISKNISNNQLLDFDEFVYYVNNKSERKIETIQHIDKEMIERTMKLVNYAINIYLTTIENQIVIGKFDKNVIRQYKIMKHELPHLLGFDFKHGLLTDKNRRNILSQIGLPKYSIEGPIFDKMQKTIELCSNSKFLEYELDRINRGLYPIVDYAAINAKTGSFLCNNSLENISRIVVLPRGVKPERIPIENSDQCSLLLSDLKCSVNYDFSSLLHIQTSNNNRYFKSNLTFKETNPDFNRMIQNQEISTDNILIIDASGNSYIVPSNYKIKPIEIKNENLNSKQINPIQMDWNIVDFNKEKFLDEVIELYIRKKAPYTINYRCEGAPLGHKLHDYLYEFPERYRDLIAKELGYIPDMSINKEDFIYDINDELRRSIDYIKYIDYKDWKEKDNINKILKEAKNMISTVDGGIEKFAEDVRRCNEIEELIDYYENEINELKNRLKLCEKKYEETKDEDYKEDIIDSKKDEIKEYEDDLEKYKTDKNNIMKKYEFLDYDDLIEKLETIFNINSTSTGNEILFYTIDDCIISPDVFLRDIQNITSKDIYQLMVDYSKRVFSDMPNEIYERDTLETCEEMVHILSDEISYKDFDLFPEEKNMLKKIVLKNVDAYEELDSIDREKIDTICDIDRFEIEYRGTNIKR